VATIKKYNLAGQEVGEEVISDALTDVKANGQMIKDYLVALRNNARQWSASTKGRADVNHTGRKPHPQKGTGRARQGCLAAPQYKGGGRVHAPLPKFDQHVRINKKERRAAIRFLIAEKIATGHLHLLKNEKLKAPKTKKVVDFLKVRDLSDKRVLFLGETKDSSSKKPAHETLMLSARNVPKVEFAPLLAVNGYDLALSRDIVIMESAFDQLLVLLGGEPS